jgi:SpoIID/LytB domain protein
MGMTRRNTSKGRHAVLITLSLALVVSPAITPLGGLAPALAAGESDEVVIEGGGWGHGIGMSQYGAQGQALEGRTATEIIEHYYTGATVADLGAVLPQAHFLSADNSPLWISLERNATTFRFGAIDGPIELCHNSNGGCSLTARPGEKWTFRVVGNGRCRFTVDGANATPRAGPCEATIRSLSPSAGKAVLHDQPSTRDTYARGRVQLRSPDGGSSIHASLELGMQSYLFGLFEVPDWFETEALRAQAIAARSYAAYKAQLYGPEEEMTATRKTQCWCHLYATVADQSFIGWLREDDAAEEPWHRAVMSTNGLVVSHPKASQNDVVAAFYSSSTGGATQNVEDVWGGSPVEYLRSVPDPWSVDPAVGNPFASWRFSFSETELAAALGLDAVSGLDIVTRHDSGAPSRIRITGRLDGKRYKEVWTGAEVKSTLGLTGRHIFSIDHGSATWVTGDYDGNGTGDAAALMGATGAWFEFSDRGRARDWAIHGDNGTIENPLSGDFDGDGRDDVVIRRSDTGARIVGLGARWTFRTRSWHAGVADPAAWEDGVVGDFDGDGRDDIAEYRTSTATWDVLRSTGSGFSRSTFYDFATQNPQWNDFVVADFDGDGRDDILHHDLVTGDLFVLFAEGAAFTPTPWGVLPGTTSHRLRAGDFDGDGLVDVAAFDTDTGTWWVVLAEPGRTSAPADAWWDFKATSFAAQVVGDFDGDGQDDIANRAPNGRWRMLIAKQGGGFKWGSWGKTPRGATVSDALVFDADADGDDDIVTYNPTTKVLHLHTSQETGFAVSFWGSLLK